MYADDTSIMNAQEGMENQAAICYNNNSMELNRKKTNIIIFNNTKEKSKTCKITRGYSRQ